jgi:thiol-disulfide isomerase/thioredoxin
LSLLPTLFLPAQAATAAAMTFDEKIAVMNVWRSTYDGLIARQPDGRYLMAYDRLFGDELTTPAIESLSGMQRARLINVVFEASAQGSGPKYLQQLLRVVDFAIARGEAQDWQLQSVHYLLTSRRDFQAAHRFATRTGLTSVIFTDAVQNTRPRRTALYLSSATNAWVRRELDMSRGAHVIVLSSPTCPPCNEAALEIASDSKLQSIFRAHSLWLAPTYAPLDAPSFAAWSNAHPEFRTAAIFDPDEWPPSVSADTQGTPTFFFFVDGQLKHSVFGWAPQGAKERIEEPLRAVGLLQP